MRYCCQLSGVLSEFNKVLFGLYSSGTTLIEFLQRGGLESTKKIILWLAKYLYRVEKDKRPISLMQCKNIQLLWSHIIDFYIQLVEGRYLDQQF